MGSVFFHSRILTTGCRVYWSCYRGCSSGNLINILKQSPEIVRCPMAWLGRIVGTQTQLYRNTLEARSLLPLDLFTASFKPSWALRPCDARIQHAHTHTLDGCVFVRWRDTISVTEQKNMNKDLSSTVLIFGDREIVYSQLFGRVERCARQIVFPPK